MSQWKTYLIVIIVMKSKLISIHDKPPYIRMRSTHHKARLRPDAVGDSLYPAVREEDAVLASHLGPVTLLLLVEIVANVVLDGVAVPSYTISHYVEVVL